MYSRNSGQIPTLVFIFLLSFIFPCISNGQEQEPLIPSSRIMDADVYDETEELIGEVDDIVVRRSGKAKKLTVEYGGFYDMGDDLIGLSFKRFNLRDEKVILRLTKEQLQTKPEFSYYERGLRPGYYHRLKPFTGSYRYPPPGYYYGPGRPSPPVEPYEWAFSPSRFLASAVTNRALINEEGTDIGIVEDLLINLNSNMVEKIVVSSEEILGTDTFVAIPYTALGLTAYGVVYDITPRELKKFPAYTYPQ